jgi:hypothetical protein
VSQRHVPQSDLPEGKGRVLNPPFFFAESPPMRVALKRRAKYDVRRARIPTGNAVGLAVSDSVREPGGRRDWRMSGADPQP